MNPMNINGCRMFGAPKDHDPAKDPPIGKLPVLVDEETRTFVSFWKFTDAERARIAAGHNIALSVLGGQPPVLLFLTSLIGPVVELNPEEDAS